MVTIGQSARRVHQSRLPIGSGSARGIQRLGGNTEPCEFVSSGSRLEESRRWCAGERGAVRGDGPHLFLKKP